MPNTTTVYTEGQWLISQARGDQVEKWVIPRGYREPDDCGGGMHGTIRIEGDGLRIDLGRHHSESSFHGTLITGKWLLEPIGPRGLSSGGRLSTSRKEEHFNPKGETQ